MRILVESLKRMYTVKKTLTKEQVAERVARGSISADEYESVSYTHLTLPTNSLV